MGLWSYLGVWGIVLRLFLWGGLLLGAGGGGVGGVEAGSPSPRAEGLAGECASGGADRRLPIYKGKKLVGYRAEEVRDYYSFTVFS